MGNCAGTTEGAACLIAGLRLKATLVLVIYLFSWENNAFREKQWVECLV